MFTMTTIHRVEVLVPMLLIASLLTG
jgi:hypothetical protein